LPQLKNREQNGNAKEQQTEALARSKAYQTVRARLWAVNEEERRCAELARTRAGIDTPAKFYGAPTCLPAGFYDAMQRLWDIGTLPDGCADTELRRTYHLIAKGQAPLTETDVVALGQMPSDQLRRLLPWLAHRLALAEAQKKVSAGLTAPPITRIEEDDTTIYAIPTNDDS
jgi:hypothetical protein